jgi:hypothetical protein
MRINMQCKNRRPNCQVRTVGFIYMRERHYLKTHDPSDLLVSFSAMNFSPQNTQSQHPHIFQAEGSTGLNPIIVR